MLRELLLYFMHVIILMLWPTLSVLRRYSTSYWTNTRYLIDRLSFWYSSKCCNIGSAAPPCWVVYHSSLSRPSRDIHESGNRGTARGRCVPSDSCGSYGCCRCIQVELENDLMKIHAWYQDGSMGNS